MINQLISKQNINILRVKYHDFLEKFFIVRYFVENPDITQLDEIRKKYLNIYSKKHYSYQMCVKSFHEYKLYSKS